MPAQPHRAAPLSAHRPPMRMAVACALVAAALLAACGDGSGTLPNPPTNNAPTGVAQPVVTPGPLGSGSASATWAPASDDATAESALVYQLHASTQADFTPGAETLLFEGAGANQASVASGLVAGTRYTFKLVVKDAQGLATTGAGTSVAMHTATPHSGVTDQQCYEAGNNVLTACSSAGADALNTQQDGDRVAVNPMSYSEVPNPAGGNFARTSCVKDNVTGLIWEGKEASGTRAGGNTYTHYDSTTSAQKWNGSTYVNPTAADIAASTNSMGYVAAVNAMALCGYTDWRLPTADELQGIVDYGVAYPGPTINTAWFPNTPSNWYWSSSPYVGFADGAWVVEFDDGYVDDYGYRNYTYAVRLVRASQ
jgi:Protein of unknown function (DUF1566)